MSGYKTELTLNPHMSDTKPSRGRKQNIIWFDHPFNNQVSTTYKYISHLAIGYTKFGTEIISKLAIAAHLARETSYQQRSTK